MENWVNWLLVIGGVVCVIVELAMGAFTGFDLMLVGVSLATGGGLGFVFGSEKIGLLSAGGLALVYFVFLRGWMRKRLTVKDHASNVDAIVGRTGVVTVRIAPHEPGQVKVGDEIWRAELAQADGAAHMPGEKVTVESVEGVTLKVR